MIPDAALRHVLDQISEADAELRAYPPAGVDWPERASATARVLVPWLAATAQELKAYMDRVLNAPSHFRVVCGRIKETGRLDPSLAASFDTIVSDVGLLLRYVTGEVASTIVMTHLEAAFTNSDLRPNGKSDYPDLWLRTNDYSALPAFTRRAGAYGAALKGRPSRPVRVPDGLEVKTCRDSIKVDCHHNHAGLHVAIVLATHSGTSVVSDVAVAFLKGTDYRRSERNTTATTEKFSFNGDRFVSLLNAT